MNDPMSKFLNYLLPCLFLVTLAACDGETSYTTRITNYSNDTIGMNLFTVYETEPILLFLTPGKSYTLSASSLNEGNEAIPDCSREIDSADISVFSGKTLFKDVLSPDDWNHRMISTRGGRFVDHFCDFEIHQTDVHF